MGPFSWCPPLPLGRGFGVVCAGAAYAFGSTIGVLWECRTDECKNVRYRILRFRIFLSSEVWWRPYLLPKFLSKPWWLTSKSFNTVREINFTWLRAGTAMKWYKFEKSVRLPVRRSHSKFSSSVLNEHDDILIPGCVVCRQCEHTRRSSAPAAEDIRRKIS